VRNYIRVSAGSPRGRSSAFVSDQPRSTADTAAADGPLAADGLISLFPYLPKQPGYNKRLRKLIATMNRPILTLARDTSMCTDDVRVIDSTPVECGRSRETTPLGPGRMGRVRYCASHSRFF
jgi:hypothetical protein